ncbi:precorrin-6B methylase/decarboxylase cbiT/cbiE [Clostridium cochlearium]|jgi:precorrin-6Y C5,15-methyltransferase (decarboxylating)|uniref:Precorrin-6B methylase/decarboxylase cbiT/cbiE n=1 Tax=Clostridium cochlearium TaxID=1494 RepID=A0A2X2W6P7_CLOCO|nr:precorrin-6B methylase/decarboxylase cbiT/cbiE [Clostridium cochlearium]
MVYIVGIGPGHRDYIMPKAIDVLKKVDIIVGFGRAMESVDFLPTKKIKVGKIKEVVETLNENTDKDIAVVASGDPLFFGITEYIKREYKKDIEIIPGISSFQYLMGKLNKSWNNAYLGSLHGREDEFLKKVKENSISVWLTDSKNSPDKLAELLVVNGLNPYMYVGEELSYEDERILEGQAEKIKDEIFSKLSVVIIENNNFVTKEDIHFIKDDEFIRGDCPMTKEEVRMLTAIKMDIKEEDKVLDIGAGTGSVSIQACKLCPLGKVIAIEKEEEAISVIRENKKKFNAHNLEIMEGEALSLKDKIQENFNSIFIGGSGGNLEDLIKEYSKKLKDNGKIVLNFITINNLYKAMNTLKELGFKVKCTQVSISKTRGETYMLMGYNPIFIIEGEKKNG